MPIWKIKAHKTWQQPNDHICGAIAINRFAFELQPYKSNAMVDKKLLQLIASPDTLQHENFSRAANLLEYLLKKKLDAVKVVDEPLMTLEAEEEFKEMDDNSIKQRIRLDAELKLLTSNACTRKSQCWMAATEQSIEAKKKRLQKMIDSPIRKKKKTLL